MKNEFAARADRLTGLIAVDLTPGTAFSETVKSPVITARYCLQLHVTYGYHRHSTKTQCSLLRLQLHSMLDWKLGAARYFELAIDRIRTYSADKLQVRPCSLLTRWHS